MKILNVSDIEDLDIEQLENRLIELQAFSPTKEVVITRIIYEARLETLKERATNEQAEATS